MLRFLRKSIVYVTAVLVLAGVAAVVLGPARIGHVFRYARRAAAENIDGMVPDEVKLRADMQKLREEYPRRIAELRSLATELEGQLAGVERDRKLCREVLALCEEDIGQLRPVLDSAPEKSDGRPSTIHFRGMDLAYPEALERGRRIVDIQQMYQARLAAGTSAAEALVGERERMAAALGDLVKEYDRFVAEYRTLEREIDLIAHHDKLIEIARSRDRMDRIDTSGWLRSLDEIKRAVGKRKTEQEETLRSFRPASRVEEYETRARMREL